VAIGAVFPSVNARDARAREPEHLLDDLQQLSDVVGELSAVLAQAKATVTSRGGHAHLSTQARP
jgi:L-lactate utilization protein LutB